MRARGCRSLLAKCSPSKVGQRVVARCKNERWSFERVYSAGSVLDAPPGRGFQRGTPQTKALHFFFWWCPSTKEKETSCVVCRKGNAYDVE